MDDAFFTVVGCMDGRIQEAVFEFGRRKFDAKFPDDITDAGIVRQIALNPELQYFEHFKEELMVSLISHRSKGILVNGHQDCAGNPTDDETHKKDVLKAVDFIKTIIDGNVRVIGVFVSLQNGKWRAEAL